MLRKSKVKGITSQNIDTIYQKIMRYCTYQDRSIIQVRSKLNLLGTNTIQSKKIIELLIHDNCVNESRYVESIVLGRFKQLHWGIIRISNYLQQQMIPITIINEAMLVLNNEEYKQKMFDIYEKYKSKYPNISLLEIQNKAFQYLYKKGFSYNDIVNTIPLVGIINDPLDKI